MRNRTLRTLLTGASLVVILGACGSATKASTTTVAPQSSATTQGPEAVVAGDIPDNQAFVAYSPGVYTIKVPEGWARTTDGPATVFSDKYNSIRIETATMPTAPTVTSVTNGDLPIIAKATNGYTAGKVSAVNRKSGQAILATYQIDATTNGVTNKTVRLDVERYVFWKNATAVVVTLSSAAGSDNVDPWKTVTDGFGWTA
jgi:hypothetical protein